MNKRLTIFAHALMSISLFHLCACSSAPIRNAFEESLAHPIAPTRTVRPVAEANAPPYHAMIRLSPKFLDTSVAGMLPDNLLEGQQLQLGGQEGKKAPPIRGPFGGFFLDRLARMRPEVNEPLTPTLHARSLNVGFIHDCNSCLRVRAKLEGGVEGAGLSPVGLGGELTAVARMQIIEKNSKPALSIYLERVDNLRLELPVDLPEAFSRIQTRLEDRIKDVLSKMLADSPEKTERVLPIGEKFKLMPGIALEGMGVRTLTDSSGELRLGLNTNLASTPTLYLDAARPPLRLDWTFVLGQETVLQMLRTSAQRGEMPTRFDRHGKADPEGPVSFELKDLRFTPDGFEVDARFWYLSFPAWWRDYTLFGTLELDGGRLLPRIREMNAGPGEGATWMGRFVERKLTSERAMRTMGKTLPTELPMSDKEGDVLHMIPKVLRCETGAMVLSGELVAPSGSAR